jgi:predicted acylesterase/phospholipase RssA
MGALAASRDPDRRERYIGVLLASVAVPGLIEPVIVRDASGREAAHGDGGVKAPILFDPAMLANRRGGRATVWIVANGHVSPHAATTAAIDGPVAAGRRGVAQLLRRLLHTKVVATYFRVRERGATFRLLALPDGVPEARNPVAFVPEEMRALYEVGFRMGRSGAGWARRPPEAM